MSERRPFAARLEHHFVNRSNGLMSCHSGREVISVSEALTQKRSQDGEQTHKTHNRARNNRRQYEVGVMDECERQISQTTVRRQRCPYHLCIQANVVSVGIICTKSQTTFAPTPFSHDCLVMPVVPSTAAAAQRALPFVVRNEPASRYTTSSRSPNHHLYNEQISMNRKHANQRSPTS